MNRFQKTAALAAFTTVSIAGGALANGIHGMNGPGAPTGAGTIQSASYESPQTRRADHSIRSWKGETFTIQLVSQIHDRLIRSTLRDSMKTDPGDVAALQAAIKDNRDLTRTLRSKNVQIHNIVGADVAMNGALTIYVN